MPERGRRIPVEYALRLYLSDQSSGARALHTLEALLETHLAGRYELEVIDVLEHPERAEGERILATPTLVRASPAPVRKAVGDLSDGDQLLAFLDLPLSAAGAEARPSAGGMAHGREGVGS